jgi:hypothetical protein
MSKPQTEKNEEIKSGTELSEEQLDNVAGGSDPQVEVTP